jgi:hypothetical protein
MVVFPTGCVAVRRSLVDTNRQCSSRAVIDLRVSNFTHQPARVSCAIPSRTRCNVGHSTAIGTHFDDGTVFQRRALLRNGDRFVEIRRFDQK